MMIKLRNTFTVLFLILFSNDIMSQSALSEDQIEVNKVVIKLFDGMRAGDSTMVAEVFRRDVRMFSSYNKKTGEAVLHQGKLADFLKAIGTPHPEIWDEKIWDTEIQIDGNIAQVWTQYAFYVGENFSHCGIDAFQMVKENGAWKIIHLMDTRRKSGCEQHQ